jgi:16S rRNA (guanine966-N2)-methyltransferase
MRVIAGDARGRKLSAPRGLATRPTLARVRESMFSRLSVRLDFRDLRVLDLFAGTGALGIEALSRGAGHVTFVDSARAAINALRRNLDALGFSDRARVIRGDVVRAIEALGARHEHFDLVLLDPPYRKGWGDVVLTRLMEFDLLSDGAWVATEVSRLEAAPAALPGLERVSLATLGDHQIALYRCLSREAAL